MPFAALSAENRIQARLDELKVSATVLSAVADISQARLSQALRGFKELENKDAERLLAITAKMVEIADAFRPLKLAMNDVSTLRMLLEEMTVTPDEIREIVAKIFT